MNSDAPPTRAIDYLRLLRLPNVFTAISDVVMGMVVAYGSLQPWPVALVLILSSCLLYSAGMVLNDVFDIEVDRRERPQRPLPAGRIPLGRARALGFGLLSGGLALGWLAGWLPGLQAATPWRSGAIASLLAACILLYDGGLKRTWFGPLGMGSCRMFNVLLGISVGAAAVEPVVFGFGVAELLVAAGIGLYIVGVTWLARHEAQQSQSGSLVVATGIMIGGIVLLGLVYRFLPDHIQPVLRRESSWFLLLGLLAFTVLRRAAIAIGDPRPQQVQLAVKHSILSLIVLDAAVVLLVGGPWLAIGVLALLVPTVILGRWVYST